MHTPTKPDFLGPIVRQRFRQDFPTGFSVSRCFDAQEFTRLVPADVMLLSPLEVSAQYDGRDHLTLEMQANARLSCARCLLPLDLPVQGACRFRIFETAAQADKAIEVLDAEESICDDDRVSLRDLLEDEILMRLSDPHVHPDCSPPRDPTQKAEDQPSDPPISPLAQPEGPADPPPPRQRPFAGLDQLLSARTSPKKP